MENTYNNKPKFDPNKGFTPVNGSSKPAFNPNADFDAVDSAEVETPKKKESSGFSLEPNQETKNQFPSLFPKNPLEQGSKSSTYYTSPSVLQSKSTSVPAPQKRKNPISDLADYAEGVNNAYSEMSFAAWKTGNEYVAPGIEEANPLTGQGDPLKEKEGKDAEEVNKIRMGDINAIVGFTNRVRTSLQNQVDETVELNTRTRWLGEAGQKSAEEREKLQNELSNVTKKAYKAIDVAVGEEAANSPLDDAAKQSLGERKRKALNDIGMGEEFDGGNYASDLLKMSYKPQQSLAEIREHLKVRPTNRVQEAEYSKWKHREEDALENIKNTQMWQFKNETSVNQSLLNYYDQKINDLLDKPSVQQFLNTKSEQERKAIANDADVSEFKAALNSAQEIYNNRNKAISKYPSAANEIKNYIMTEAFAEDFMKENGMAGFMLDAATGNMGKFSKRLIVGDTPDTEEEIKAIAEATGFSEDDVRKHAKDIRLPSYLGEALRGGAHTVAGTFQWVNRMVLPENEAEVRNSQIDQSLYRAPQSLQLTGGNINPETVFRTMGNGAGQFAAMALESYALGAGIGAAGRVATRTVAGIGEAAGVTEKVFSGAPKLGRLLNIADAYLGGTTAEVANAGSRIEKIVKAGERARSLAGTFASGYTSSYESAYKEAQRFSSDPSKWAEYADASAFLNGVSELILPDIDIAKKMVAVSGVKQFLRTGTSSVSKADLMKQFMGKLGSVVGQETLEEYIPLIGETLAKEKIFNYQTSTADFFKQLWDTTLQTVVSTIPMGVLGTRGANSSHFTKSTLYEIAKQPDKYQSLIDRMADNGMSQETANERKQLVNTLSDIYSKLPSTDKNGNELSESARMDLMASIFSQRWNEQQKKNTDKAVHQPLNETINAAQEQINTIMDGNHVEAVEVSSMRDNLETARAAAQTTTNASEQPSNTPNNTVNQTANGDIVDNILGDIFGGDLTNERQYTDAEKLQIRADELTMQANSMSPDRMSEKEALWNEAKSLREQATQLNTQSNAATESTQERQPSEEAANSNTGNINPAQSQQEGSQEGQAIGQSDNSNRTEAGQDQSQAEMTLQDRLNAARAGIVETAPTMQENLDAARRAEDRRRQREAARVKRNQIIDEQTQGDPITPITVAPTENGTHSIVSEEEQPIASGEVTPSQNERRNVPGVFRFGEVQNVPIESISTSDAFRGRRKLRKEAIRFFRKNNSNEPVMVYRHENGRIYVLDGKARLEAKRANRRKTVPVRFFNGTYEEAMRYAELSRPAPAGDNLRKRIARVTMHDPQSFEEAVLQALVGKGKRRHGFSRADFARVMGFGAVSTNRNSIAYGRMIGFADIKDAVKNGLLRENGISFNEFTQDWLTRNEGVDGGLKLGFGNQNDLLNELGETILRYQSDESIVRRLEELNGLQGEPLQETALPFDITEEEATFIAENDLSSVMDSILNNASDIEVTEEEQAAYEELIRANANQDNTFDLNSIYNQLVSSDNPALISLRNKLSRYATTEETITKSLGNTGSENVAELEDEDYFSRGVGASTALTEEQAKKVGKTLSKAFKGLKVVIDRDAFAEAVRKAVGKFSKKLSEQAEYVATKLTAATTELQTAKDELAAKRKQLDRSIVQDQQDLFGGRQSDQSNMLFSERVDLSAREKALKPFQDRVQAAQQRVIQLQDQLNKIVNQAPQQQSLFSRIPFQRRLQALKEKVIANRGSYGFLIQNMIDENIEETLQFVADQYADPDSRKAAIETFGEDIAIEASRLFPPSSSFDKPLLSTNGDILGMVYNGDVYLNPDAVRSDTPLHEIGGHILTAWAKVNQPELYNKIIEVAKSAPEELINEVRKNYPDLSDVHDAFWEEVFSTFVGLDARNTARAEQLAEVQGIGAIRQAIRDIWNDFVNFLIDKGLFKPTETFNADDFREMSLSDFSNMVGEKMFEGRRLSAPAYDLRSIPEYENLADTDLLHDNWGNPIAVLPAGQQKVADKIVAQRRKDIKSNATIVDPRFQRIGSSARLTPIQKESFKVAMQMQGTHTNQEIFLATGWFQDTADKNFRYELPNDNVKFLPMQHDSVAYNWFLNKGVYPVQVDKYYDFLSTEQKAILKEAAATQSMPLQYLLDYPELYEVYPEMRNLTVRFANLKNGVRGQYVSVTNEITLDNRTDPFNMYVVLRHEIQHAIQNREGFETGSNQSLAEIYYNRKLNHAEGVLERLQRNLQHQMNSGQETPEREEHVNYLKERIREYSEEIAELKSDKDGWIYFFYRNFAGEREANAVMDRARIPDELRVVTPPLMMSGESAITHGDQLAIKKIASREEELPQDENAMFESTAGYEQLEFNSDGSIKYDKIKQLREEIKRHWAEYQSLGINSDPIERHRKNMQLYGLIIRLAGEYVKSGIKNISDYFAHSEFAKLFGVDRYEDLPDTVKTRVANVLQMNEAQRKIVLANINGALRDGGDVQKNLESRLNSVRDQLKTAEQRQDAPAERPRLRWVYNERTEKWEQAPFTQQQVDADEELRNFLTQDVPGIDEVNAYLSGDTIGAAYGERPLNNQDYNPIKLQDALNHGENIIAAAKRAWGIYYAEPMLDFIAKAQTTPSIKALMYVSLENSLAQDKIDYPGRATEIAKVQTAVYEQSQAYMREISKSLNYGRLRNIAFYGFTPEDASNRMFTPAEVKDRKGVEKAIEATSEDVNRESDTQQTTEPDYDTIAANAEATEKNKATQSEGKKPKRKKSSKEAWAKKAEEKALLKEKLAQLKQDIRDINC